MLQAPEQGTLGFAIETHDEAFISERADEAWATGVEAPGANITTLLAMYTGTWRSVPSAILRKLKVRVPLTPYDVRDFIGTDSSKGRFLVYWSMNVCRQPMSYTEAAISQFQRLSVDECLELII